MWACVQVSSSVLFFDASFGSSVSLDASIQPSSYLSSDGSSTTIYRSMVSLDLANTGQQGSVPAVAFLGEWPLQLRQRPCALQPDVVTFCALASLSQHDASIVVTILVRSHARRSCKHSSAT